MVLCKGSLEKVHLKASLFFRPKPNLQTVPHQLPTNFYLLFILQTHSNFTLYPSYSLQTLYQKLNILFYITFILCLHSRKTKKKKNNLWGPIIKSEIEFGKPKLIPRLSFTFRKNIGSLEADSPKSAETRCSRLLIFLLLPRVLERGNK